MFYSLNLQIKSQQCCKTHLRTYTIKKKQKIHHTYCVEHGAVVHSRGSILSRAKSPRGSTSGRHTTDSRIFISVFRFGACAFHRVEEWTMFICDRCSFVIELNEAGFFLTFRCPVIEGNPKSFKWAKMTC